MGQAAVLPPVHSKQSPATLPGCGLAELGTCGTYLAWYGLCGLLLRVAIVLLSNHTIGIDVGRRLPHVWGLMWGFMRKGEAFLTVRWFTPLLDPGLVQVVLPGCWFLWDLKPGKRMRRG